ncbi:unnamed protein product, partial [marine sediment metagenome]
AERARYESFRREQQAYRACPQVYCFDRQMDVWDEVLPDIRKYVLGVDPEKIELWVNVERGAEVMAGVYEDQE